MCIKKNRCGESERKVRLGYSLSLISLLLVARHLLKSKPEKHPKVAQTNICTSYETDYQERKEKQAMTQNKSAPVI